LGLYARRGPYQSPGGRRFFGGGAEYGEAAGCPIFKSLLARFAVFLGFFFLNFKFEILILGVLTFFLKNLEGVFLIPSDYGDHVFTGELAVFFFFFFFFLGFFFFVGVCCFFFFFFFLGANFRFFFSFLFYLKNYDLATYKGFLWKKMALIMLDFQKKLKLVTRFL